MKINNTSYKSSFFIENETSSFGYNRDTPTKQNNNKNNNNKGIRLPILFTKFNINKKKNKNAISGLFTNQELQTINQDSLSLNLKSFNFDKNLKLLSSPLPKLKNRILTKQPNYILLYKNIKKFKEESKRSLYSDSKTIGLLEPKKVVSMKKFDKMELVNPKINSTFLNEKKFENLNEIANQLKKKQFILFMKFCRGKGNEILSNSLCSNMAQSILHEQLEKLNSQNLKMANNTYTDIILKDVIQNLKLKNFDNIQSTNLSTFNPRFIESNSNTNFISYNYYKKLRSFRPLVSKATLFSKSYNK